MNEWQPGADAAAVVVRVGSTEFGIDVRPVREVLRPPAITRLPFPPPSILGIVSVRGTLVPIMDLGDRLLGTAADRSGRLVVAREPDGPGFVGLLVDAVLDLVPLEGLSAGSVPPEVERSLPEGWVSGVISPTPERLVTMLDLPQVLDIHTPAAEERR